MKSPVTFLLVMAVLAAGCSPLVLKPADFAWPIEDVLKSDSLGMVHEDRYNLSFSIKPLLYSEMKDSVDVSNRVIRLIRGVDGHYYITGPKFKNVYVFSQGEGGLTLNRKIPVSKEGLTSPAFNQRIPYIELLNGNDKPIFLTKDGIRKEGAK